MSKPDQDQSTVAPTTGSKDKDRPRLPESDEAILARFYPEFTPSQLEHFSRTGRYLKDLRSHTCQELEPPNAPRPAYHRDHAWLNWYEAKNEATHHSHVEIRDKWNGLSEVDRKRIAPSFYQKISAGEAGRQVVITGVKKAIEERKTRQS